MSMDGSYLIGIITTAISVIGFPITILLVFFEVKPVQKKQISAIEMAVLLGLTVLLGIGIVNLNAVNSMNQRNRDEQGGKDQTEDSQEPDGQGGQDGSEQEAGGIGHSISPEEDLSPEELLIRENWDEIQRQKAAYSEADTKVIESESGSVELYLYEEGGFVFQDLTKNEDCDVLLGTDVPFATVVIMDYSSDAVICPLNSGETGMVRYSPGNQRKFYCVVFHDEYDICVTRPFQVAEGEKYAWDTIFLEKSGSRYTPPFQLRLYTQSLDLNEGYSIVPPDYNVKFLFKNMTDNQPGGTTYQSSVTEAGILQWGGNTYFSLNTDYVMDLYIQRESGTDWIDSKHQTFDGSVTNSNQIDLYFTFEQEDSNP